MIFRPALEVEANVELFNQCAIRNCAQLVQGTGAVEERDDHVPGFIYLAFSFQATKARIERSVYTGKRKLRVYKYSFSRNPDERFGEDKPWGLWNDWKIIDRMNVGNMAIAERSLKFILDTLGMNLPLKEGQPDTAELWSPDLIRMTSGSIITQSITDRMKGHDFDENVMRFFERFMANKVISLNRFLQSNPSIVTHRLLTVDEILDEMSEVGGLLDIGEGDEEPDLSFLQSKRSKLL